MKSGIFSFKKLNRILILFMISFFVSTLVIAQQDLEIIYSSPVESSRWNKIETNIILKTNRPFSNDEFAKLSLLVTDSENQIIDGNFFLPDQKSTLIFNPSVPFKSGDKVRVLLRLLQQDKEELICLSDFYFELEHEQSRYSRDIVKQDFEFIKTPNSLITGGAYSPNENYKLRDLPESFPEFEITVNNNPQPGFYFLNAFFVGGSGDPAYLMILDSTGFPVFYREFEQQVSCFIFQEETGTLTYWDNTLLLHLEMDSSFRTLKSYTAKNGYITDGHELILKSNGNYWIIALDHQLVDMSQFVPGGDTAAIVEGMVLQEIDSFGNVVFQWRSWDHFAITDADPNIVDLTAHFIDYVHTNAIHFDEDDNILISSRNLSEITKIDYTTGNILWRWGGQNNEFVISGDNPVFLAQHDIRYIGNNMYTLFDNGIMDYRPYSRGLVFSLNQANKTGTLLYDFRDADSVIFSRFMGSMRYQENENYLGGWSANMQQHVVTEYNPDGQAVFEIKSIDTAGLVSYRAMKYDWETNLFDIDEDILNFGNDIVVGDSVLLELTVRNNDTEEIEINGFHTLDNAFSVETLLPEVIPAGGERQFTVKFKPTSDTNYVDVLSLVFDTEDSRVANQVRLTGGGIITSITEIKSFFTELEIHPNPASGLVTINYELPAEGQLQLEVVNLTGNRCILLQNESMQVGKYQFRFDAARLEKGLYLVKIQLTTKNNRYSTLAKFVRN